MSHHQISSALNHLVCPECGRTYEPDRLQTFCQECRSPLLARYDLDWLRGHLTPDQVKSRPRGVWRWAELLPVRDPDFRLTLGEGDTPLWDTPRLGAALGLPRLYVKDESLNPLRPSKRAGWSWLSAGRWNWEPQLL